MIRIMKKSRIVILLIILFFLIISIRLFFLGVIKHEDYQKKLAEKTNVTVLGLSAPRGRILDTNGKIIVDNIGINTIMYHKIKGITTKEEIAIARRLGKILNVGQPSTQVLKDYWLVLNDGNLLITEEEWQMVEERKLTTNEIKEKQYERITDDMLNYSIEEQKAALIYSLMNEGYNYQKKVILNKASDAECALVAESNLPGITIEMSWQRHYVYGDTMKSVLGSVGPIAREEKNSYLAQGYEITDIVGRSYLEKEYEEFLKGEKAVYQVNKDNTLTLIKEAQRGKDLVLAIDIDIQKQVEATLEDKIMLGKKSFANTEYYKESYAVVSNPNTGAIIALAGKRLNQDGTFTDVATNNINTSYTIGSAVKGATIAVGYKYNLITMDKYITDGCVKLYAVPAKCSHKSLGRINDLTALAQSSNYYQFLIAIGLTGNKYYPNLKLNATAEHFQIYRDTLANFGLGAITGIDLPGEVAGIKGAAIADDLLLNLAIGQYDTYTPIEVIQYVNSVASGQRYQLALMQKIISDESIIKTSKPKVLNDIDLSSEVLERIRLGMSKVLSEGTGKGYVDVSLNPVGKTGTSQTFIDNNHDGVMETSTVSSAFAGYFPKDDPQYSVVVITPNISYRNGRSEAMYYGARRMTNEITNFLAQYNPHSEN